MINLANEMGMASASSQCGSALVASAAPLSSCEAVVLMDWGGRKARTSTGISTGAVLTGALGGDHLVHTASDAFIAVRLRIDAADRVVL